MKNFKFYLGAFLFIFCVQSVASVFVAISLSLVVKIVTNTFIFWHIWGTLEAWCLIDALYLTFTRKVDPWS